MLQAVGPVSVEPNPVAKVMRSPVTRAATASTRSHTVCGIDAPPYCSTRTREKKVCANAASRSSASANSAQPAGTMLW